jgi:hypothetical protein
MADQGQASFETSRGQTSSDVGARVDWRLVAAIASLVLGIVTSAFAVCTANPVLSRWLRLLINSLFAGRERFIIWIFVAELLLPIAGMVFAKKGVQRRGAALWMAAAGFLLCLTVEIFYIAMFMTARHIIG